MLINVDTLVEEAADAVCNTGLDIGGVIIENDDSSDAEEGRIDHFRSDGCKCQLSGGEPCHTLFTATQIRAARDECHQLTHDQLDMVVMGQLQSKANNTVRQHSTTLFHFGGHRICRIFFLFLHAMGTKRFKAIKQSWLERGLSPQITSKILPHNTTRLSDVKCIVRFVLQYAEDHAILLPGRIPGYKRDDLQLLPSSTTKRQVWKMYHQAASASADTTAVCYSLFCALWKQLTPQVVVTHPMSDLCWMCQQNSTLIMHAHNRPVEEKSEVNIIHVHYFI